jgi:hypothetical protein
LSIKIPGENSHQGTKTPGGTKILYEFMTNSLENEAYPPEEMAHSHTKMARSHKKKAYSPEEMVYSLHEETYSTKKEIRLTGKKAYSLHDALRTGKRSKKIACE